MMMSVGMISFHAAPSSSPGPGANRYYSVGKKTRNTPRMQKPLLVLVLLFFSFTGWCSHSEAGLPVILNRRRQFLQVRQKARDLPYILLAERFVPGGHPGVTDAGTDGVKDMPLGIVRRIGDEIRSRRVKRVTQRGGFAIQSTVAESAVHGV